MQQHQGPGSSLPPRRPDGGVSPTPSDTSDSDISLGTHSPVPSNLSLQHSPGSTSNSGNDRDDSLHPEEDKVRDYSNTLAAQCHPPISTSAINSFRMDTAASLFAAGRYLPNFSGLAGMTHFPIQPTVIRPHPQLPQSLGLNGHPAMHALPHHYVTGIPPAAAAPKIRVNSPEKLNSTAAAAAVAAVASGIQTQQRTTNTSSPVSIQETQQHHSAHQLLHRPFSTSPQPPPQPEVT